MNYFFHRKRKVLFYYLPCFQTKTITYNNNYFNKMFGQQDTTHILTADINFSSKQNLQKLISTTLSRWNVIKGHTEWNEHIYYDDTVAKKTNRLSNDTYLFEVETIGANTYDVSMSVFGSRYRRGGSSMDFFERLMDALEVQLLNPDTEFAKMTDCYNLAYPPLELDFLNSGLEEVADLEAEASEAEEDLEEDDEDLEADDEDLEADDEDLEAGDIPLSKMTDDQIADYSEALGRAPREEIDEWTLNYEGGSILRYSYVKFTGTTVTDQIVDDITITGSIFNSATLKNCRFSNVHFYECDFTDVKIKNTKFKKCNFFDCELPQYVKVEHSCLISNM